MVTYNYPRTTIAAYDVLCCYKKPTPQFQVHSPPSSVAFIQSGDIENNNTVPGNDGRSFPTFTCYLCEVARHYAVIFLLSVYNTHVGTQSIYVRLTMTKTTKGAPNTNIINSN